MIVVISKNLTGIFKNSSSYSLTSNLFANLSPIVVITKGKVKAEKLG